MSTTQDRDDVLLMARIAGLDLPPAFHDELIEAHAKLQSILARMPRDRDRGDEPAHVFVPERFMPVE